MVRGEPPWRSRGRSRLVQPLTLIDVETRAHEANPAPSTMTLTKTSRIYGGVSNGKAFIDYAGSRQAIIRPTPPLAHRLKHKSKTSGGWNRSMMRCFVWRQGHIAADDALKTQKQTDKTSHKKTNVAYQTLLGGPLAHPPPPSPQALDRSSPPLPPLHSPLACIAVG